MVRRSAILPVAIALMLSACGGGETASTQPVDNAGEADLALPVDEPVFDGDNLTAIDAAANGATSQSLAPDANAAGVADTANGSAPAE